MDSNNFISKSADSFYPIKEETVLSSLMQRYKIVIIESLITAFGLDRMILDQHGGDVDTIHTVRQIDSDPDMEYKNLQNQANYENRGPYNRASARRFTVDHFTFIYSLGSMQRNDLSSTWNQ